MVGLENFLKNWRYNSKTTDEAVLSQEPVLPTKHIFVDPFH